MTFHKSILKDIGIGIINAPLRSPADWRFIDPANDPDSAAEWLLNRKVFRIVTPAHAAKEWRPAPILR